MIAKPTDLQAFAQNAINLASAGLGARVVFVTDEFFAPSERMLQDHSPIFIPDKYDENGKWMDGWESRRRRGGGHDEAIVRLAVPGVIHGFDIDTSHFTGNYPPAVSIEACRITDEADPDENTEWTEVLRQTEIGPDSDGVWTHLRVHIWPDGGIARFRAYGEPHLDLDQVRGKTVDLASALVGGRVLTYSDAHYGAYYRILAPGRGRDMGDGWETRRRRGPGHDWIVIALGARGTIESARVDTAHYKGNYPDACSIQAADLGDVHVEFDEQRAAEIAHWPEFLPRHRLSADKVHDFDRDRVNEIGPVTHIVLNIYPDGGISRLRLFGKIAG
jgi:allantoicase